jgi:streptomycin 6-kinase
MIEIPEAFARATIDREGEAGAAWLATLPALAEGLFERWQCVPDGAVTHGGVGLIIPVQRPHHDEHQRAAVLKISFPHPGNVAEPDAFEAWDGRGAVRLYERDDAHFAMLLERAHTSTLAEVRDNDEIARVTGRLNRRLAVPAPPGLPRLSDLADEWEESLCRDARELVDAVPQTAVDAALATIRELGRDQPELIVHGDLHARNILRADREPWLVVDPKGYAGDPAYDGGTLLRTVFGARMTEISREDELGRAVLRLLEFFTESAELEYERVRRWANFHAVSSVFWAYRHGFRAARSGSELGRVLDRADRLVLLLA